jgi:thiamine biosynthesis lipoprotein
LNFGGQILLFGSATPAARAAGLDEIVVAAPDPSAAASAAAFAAGDGSVSTSGDSEKPGHLVDPRTGRVSRFHGSATVRAASGLRADALSTALFVLGPSEGVAFAARRGIAALYVFRDGRRLATSTSPAFPRLARPAHRKETA